jgi:hypothetical protein
MSPGWHESALQVIGLEAGQARPVRLAGWPLLAAAASR